MELKTPSICAAIIARTIDGFLEALDNTKGADVIELRADGLEDETQVKELLERTRALTNLPLILTVRAKEEGGEFLGSEEARIACIKDALELADMVDIELGMNEKERDGIVALAKSKGVGVILSHHNFDKTPEESEMISALQKEEAAGADIAKIAVKANFSGDVIRLLNVTQEMTKKLKIPLCTISMGKEGAISRIASPIFGSALTYGYVKEKTAPGQLSVRELDTVLRSIGVRK